MSFPISVNSGNPLAERGPVTAKGRLFHCTVIATIAASLVLAACGGGGGSAPIGAAAPVQTVVNIAVTPASVPLGQSATLTWSATNATACTASGAWSGSQSTSGSVSVAPSPVGNYTYSLTCSGSGGNASGATVLGVTNAVSANNVAQVVVENGPPGTSGTINLPYVTVTVCVPGTATCQDIDHVIVDTGSSGLRILASTLNPALALPAVTGAGGNPAGECAQFTSGFLWGSVRNATVKMAGETAPSVPIQLVGDPALGAIPSSCTSTGANMGTLAALGAKGLLGVGFFKQDCGAACATASIAGTYYECTAAGCTSVAMPLNKQVTHPVAAFTTDNNGIVLVMPAVPPGGATSLTGALIFGVDSQLNNQVGTATVYFTNSAGNFTTVYKGGSLTSSFLDSGSNGLFFTDAAIPRCTFSVGFYCPLSTLSLSAVNRSPVNNASGTVNFTIENAEALNSTIKAAQIGGNIGRRSGGNTFVWGFPLFFGRTVFVAMDGAVTPQGTGPYWAY